VSRVCRRWLVEGRVQGVFFRQSTCEEAARLGIGRGWVRNLPDGRVEVLAEGSPEQLDELSGFLSEGPSAARVERLQEVPPGDDGPPGGPFRVRS